MASIAAAARYIGWKLVSAFAFEMADGTLIEMLTVAQEEWAHAVREAIRLTEWRAAAGRRKDMEGIERGIDREATLVLVNGSRLTPIQKGTLRSILAGAVWTEDRRHRAKQAASPFCPYCRKAIEDHFHMWRECPAWSAVRARYGFTRPGFASQWPACLAICGILPAQPTATENTAYEVIDLTDDDVVDLTLDDAQVTAAALPCEAWNGGRVVVYTDGASKDNQYRSLRRAGLGVFWGPRHPWNLAEPLRGPVQTNNRAELTAVIRALESDTRPLEIRTDSMYVYKGCVFQLDGWRTSVWRGKHKEISNADLWMRLGKLLALRSPEDVAFVKVKAHASHQDVAAGRVTAEDKLGNDGADGLAVAGAAMHAISASYRQMFLQQALFVQGVQRMMVDILDERARPQQGPAVPAPHIITVEDSSTHSSHSQVCRNGSRASSGKSSRQSNSSRTSNSSDSRKGSGSDGRSGGGRSKGTRRRSLCQEVGRELRRRGRSAPSSIE